MNTPFAARQTSPKEPLAATAEMPLPQVFGDSSMINLDQEQDEAQFGAI
jgi:hypothetical protein